ncbi:hypothetical protein [Methylomonas sp. MgM2]
MKNRSEADAVKRAKNIAAILYMLALAFVVGGSYLHQQQTAGDNMQSQAGW